MKTRHFLRNSEKLKKDYKLNNISILKGPCLAKELAKKNHTSVIVANRNINIAKKIGTIGHLTKLTRTTVGSFSLDESLTVEKFEEEWIS